MHVLHLEDSTLDAELVAEFLRADGLVCEITRVWTREDYTRALTEHRYTLILADHQLPSFDGHSALDVARETAPNTPFIFVSGTLGEEVAVEAMQHGATDYVVKQRLERLPIVAKRALAEAAVRDERRQALRALRESETSLRAMANSIDQMIWAAKPDGAHDYYNDRWYEFTGTAAGSTVAAEWSGLFHPEDRQRALCAWRSSLASGDQFHLEYRLRHKDGEYRWVLGRARPVRDLDGRIVRWFGTCTDIHEIVAARDVLANSERELARQVAERTRERDRAWANALDLLVVSDMEGVIRAANPAWTNVLGWDQGEVVGHKAIEFVHPDDREQSARTIARSRKQRISTREARYRHKDGSYRWISWVASPDEGLVYASGRDITAEKQQAAALEHAQDALRQSQKLQAVGQLTGGIAHDFNNMLAVVIGGLELIQRRFAAGRYNDLARFIESAMAGANRAAALTQRLLAFSRQQTLAPEPVDVNHMVVGMSELLSRTLGEQVRVRTLMGSALWNVCVDLTQLESSLLNLSVNARDAMPEGGTLTIQTGNVALANGEAAAAQLTPGDYISIAISDTGVGMSEEIMAQAFDPFFTTKGVGQGTGLGLSQVFGFVQQSGGQVRITSRPGHGTTVRVYLPRYAGDLAPAASARGAGLSVKRGEGEVVLVVEDEERVRAYSVDALQELGYAVLQAPSGPEALRVLEGRADISLLFTDIVMPEMTGRRLADLAGKLRPDLKVLYTTGYSRNVMARDGIIDPGTNFLPKPFSIDQLSVKVREALEG